MTRPLHQSDTSGNPSRPALPFTERPTGPPEAQSSLAPRRTRFVGSLVGAAFVASIPAACSGTQGSVEASGNDPTSSEIAGDPGDSQTPAGADLTAPAVTSGSTSTVVNTSMATAPTETAQPVTTQPGVNSSLPAPPLAQSTTTAVTNAPQPTLAQPTQPATVPPTGPPGPLSSGFMPDLIGQFADQVPWLNDTGPIQVTVEELTAEGPPPGMILETDPVPGAALTDSIRIVVAAPA